MGQCLLREMGLENQEWSANRKERLFMHLKQYKEQEEHLNKELERRQLAALETKRLRQLEIEKEIRRIKRGGEVSDSEGEGEGKKQLEHIEEADEESSVIESSIPPPEEDDMNFNNDFDLEQEEAARLAELQRKEEEMKNKKLEDNIENELAMYFGMSKQKKDFSTEQTPKLSQKAKSIKRQESQRDMGFEDNKQKPQPKQQPQEIKKFSNTLFQQDVANKEPPSDPRFSNIFSDDEQDKKPKAPKQK